MPWHNQQRQEALIHHINMVDLAGIEVKPIEPTTRRDKLKILLRQVLITIRHPIAVYRFHRAVKRIEPIMLEREAEAEGKIKARAHEMDEFLDQIDPLTGVRYLRSTDWDLMKGIFWQPDPGAHIPTDVEFE